MYRSLAIVLLSISSIQSQNIKVYFNQSVDNSVSSITDANTSSYLDDTICSLINSANNTLDIAVWDNGSSKIITAINNAYTSGVQVRYISSTNSTNTALSGLNTNIPVLKRNASLNTNTMHNKFVIVDNVMFLTGSMNFGNGSIFDDYNNIVIISDVPLAQNYTTEFNEMWGSTGALPNTSLSKFGPDKTDNTIHSFTISGTTVQSYFSPTDNTTAQIVNAINSADFSLDIATFTFTNNDIGDAVVAAKNRGVNVRCIIENVNYFGSEYSGLINNGINVLSHENTAMDFHHKYCIIDATNTGSDPSVVTGSHNWTNSAEDDYDENTLIIHNGIIANQYMEEFTKRFTELGGVGVYETKNDVGSKIYPNPNNGNFSIKSEANNACKIEVLNFLGEIIYDLENVKPGDPIYLNVEKGLYFLQITTEKTVNIEKIVIN